LGKVGKRKIWYTTAYKLIKVRYMNDMYIDVTHYVIETGRYGFCRESDDDEVMEWLVSQGDSMVEEILEDMINDYR